MEYLWGLLGVLIGSIMTSIIQLMRTGYGTLRIDHSNPEKDIYRFEIDKFEDLSKKKRVLLHIDNNADLSHK